MGKHEAYCVPEGAGCARADKVLAGLIKEVSRERLKQAFKAGGVCRQGKLITGRETVQDGDVLEVDLSCLKTQTYIPKPLSFEIISEDEDLIVINKPSGVLVHPGVGVRESTLVEAISNHTPLVGGQDPLRIGVVHRLDRETTGLVVFAKTLKAYEGLTKAFAERQVKKCYEGLIWGVPELLSGSIKVSLGRDRKWGSRRVMPKGGKEAHTDWEVLETYGSIASLVRCFPRTGRTHQIRVHLAHLGHYLLGDALYGYRKGCLTVEFRKFFLHAKALALQHPTSGESVQWSVSVPQSFVAQKERLSELTAGS